MQESRSTSECPTPCSIQLSPVLSNLSHTVSDALSRSSAHGISRIPKSKDLPTKLMWSILFLVFLGFFCSTTVNLVQKLTHVKIVKTYKLDNAPFVFPDLYFCPNHPYSGSFPFVLNESQADLINAEVERLNDLYSQLYCSSNICEEPYNITRFRAAVIQHSLPVHLMHQFLLHRLSQSVLRRPFVYSEVRRNTSKIELREASVPNNMFLMCIQLIVAEQERENFAARNSRMLIELFTDPFFPELGYSGKPIKPIVNPETGESIPFLYWHPEYGQQLLKNSGFTLLIAPKGVYPSIAHETRLKLAPGKSYQISIRMEENRYSDELHGGHCMPHNENAVFKDHLTDDPTEFKYSYAACWYEALSNAWQNRTNHIYSDYPVPWALRHAPRWENLTESLYNRSVASYLDVWDYINSQEAMIAKTCLRKSPCVFQSYYARYSFDNWPSSGSSLVEYFSEYDALNDENSAPAMAQLRRIARELKLGNHSAHTEAMFRSFIAESMLEVRIEAESALSPQLIISHSYSMTAFLADIGGLLGLYIGCSLLTVCELFELLYLLALSVAPSARRLRQGRRGDDVNAEPVVGDGEEMDALTSA